MHDLVAKLFDLKSSKTNSKILLLLLLIVYLFTLKITFRTLASLQH